MDNNFEQDCIKAYEEAEKVDCPTHGTQLKAQGTVLQKPIQNSCYHCYIEAVTGSMTTRNKNYKP